MIYVSYYQQIVVWLYVMGGMIWNFVDFGFEGRKDLVFYINSKGILYYDCMFKDSYFYYQVVLS